MDDTVNPIPTYITSILRTVLGIVAGWVIGKGWFTAEQWAQVAGGLAAVGTLLWSVYSKYVAHKKLAQAIAAPAGKAS